MASEIDTFLGKFAAIPTRKTPLGAWLGTERFEVHRRLGGGTFGEVYEASDRKNGTRVALKTLKRTDPGSLYRFKKEFRTVADLSHPNLVKLYELSQEADNWYLTMELIEGIRFDDYLKRAPEQLVSAFSQLASAIDAMHRAGTLHRDIKPSNVLVEETGRVVLLDFGLAWQTESKGHTMSAGTPLYMAPEQSMGEPGEASDWYSLGIILFEAIAGEPPFDGSPASMARKKIFGQLPAIEGVSGGTAKLAELAVGLLSPDPSDRPSRGDVLAAFKSGPATAEAATETFDFVGREDELRQLESALSDSRASTQLVLIEGPPGMGKSILARKFCGVASAHGASVYDGRCYEAESVPYKGIDGAVDKLCNQLVHDDPGRASEVLPKNAYSLSQMFPVLKRLDPFSNAADLRDRVRSPHEVRREATAALRDLLATLAEGSPTILFIDDLQWAGDDTLALLLGLLGGDSLRVLVLATARPGSVEDGDPLARFVERASNIPGTTVRKLPLPPLDRASVDLLLKNHPHSALTAETAWRDSGGHPYLLARIVQHEQRFEQTTSLTESLRLSVQRLSGPARRVLELITLSAMPLTQSAACSAAGLDGWRPEVVDELRKAGLVTTASHAESVMTTYHDRVRETVRTHIDQDQHRALHATLAAYLEQSRLPPAHVLATHYRESGQRLPARNWALKAARAAASSLAFARAAEHYATAVELADDEEEALRLHLEWGESMAQTGNRAESGRICLAGAERARAAGLSDWAAQLCAAAGGHLLISGHFDYGVALLEEALIAVGAGLPDDKLVAVAKSINIGGELAARGLDFEVRSENEIDPHVLQRVDLLLAAAQALNQNDIRSTYMSCMALLEALEAGEPRRVCTALVWFAMSNGQRAPKHPFFVTVLARAEFLAEHFGGSLERARACVARGVLHLFAGEFSLGQKAIEQAHRGFWHARPPHATDGGMARVALLSAYGYGGASLPRAVDRVDEWIAETDDREDHNASNWLRLMSTWTLLAHDEPVAAREELERAQASSAKGSDDIFSAMCLLNLAAIKIYESPGEAWKWFDSWADQAFRGIIASIAPLPRCTFALYRAHAVAGALQADTLSLRNAQQVIEDSIEQIEEGGCFLPGIDGLRAQLALLSRDRQQAARLYEFAATGWREKGQIAHALCAALRAAQCRGEALGDRIGALEAFSVRNPNLFANICAGPAPVEF